jgi:gamma-D-glutamyl-L-lysine dipeptidyl-peptidase
MEFFICNLSVIPIRKEASDKSEMTSQLLFGEIVELLKKDKQWRHVRCVYDGYTGWIDEKQVIPISEKFHQKYLTHQHSVSMELSYAVMKDDKGFPVLMGSTLPCYDGLTFKIEKDSYIFNGFAANTQEIVDMTGMVEKVCFKYLNSPYLWGGRTPFGIDCSGFTQMVYKAIGIPIKRDAYQQIDHGENIDFVESAKPGDLAFFVNKEGKVHHVGIVLKNQQIIHASGFVRIDKLDNNGIFNVQTKKYTHQLKLIKRLF